MSDSERGPSTQAVLVVSLALATLLLVVTGDALAAASFALGGLFAWRAISGYRGERRERAGFQPVAATVRATRKERVDDDRVRPVVEYAYTVDGEEYVNDRLLPGGTSDLGLREDRIAGFLESYEVGDEVEVYHDPDDPATSFLISRGRSGTWLLLGLLGVVSVAAGVVRLAGVA